MAIRRTVSGHNSSPISAEEGPPVNAKAHLVLVRLVCFDGRGERI
jgi:hypothetical protein